MKYFKKIEGEKVYLSPINLDDYELYVKWLNNPNITQYLDCNDSLITLSKEKELLEAIGNEEFCFGIINKEDDTLVINPNSISISILNWKEFEKNNFNNLNGKEINNMDINSFIINNTNDESITKMIGILNDNKIYIKDLPNIFLENKNSIAIRPNIKKQNIKITNKKNNKTGNNIQYNKNQLQKYLKTSSNATTNSSLLSKKNKKKQTKKLKRIMKMKKKLKIKKIKEKREKN